MDAEAEHRLLVALERMGTGLLRLAAAVEQLSTDARRPADSNPQPDYAPDMSQGTLTRRCRHCGTGLIDQANVCAACGREQRTVNWTRVAVLLAIGVVLVIFALDLAGH